MKRIALLTALVAVAACSKGDKGAADTTAASATVAPATDSAGGAMTSSSSQSAAAAAQRAADSAHMAASGTPTPAPDHKTGGAMGGDSAGMGGTHNDTTKKKP